MLATSLSLALPERSGRRSQGLPQSHPALPGFYGVSAVTEHSQNLAVQQWLAGHDTAGLLVGDLRVPTLIAGGTWISSLRLPTTGS